jgi:putative SOS response-associated peptidase YedK
VCGRYTLSTVDGPEIAQRFGLISPPDEETLGRFNVCPTETIAVVLEPSRAASVAWGLRPFRNQSFAPINVRSETVAQRFKWLMTGGRCLVLADGWYEWQKPEDPRQPRRPVRFSMASGDPFCFAGLWASESAPSCTIVTCAANSVARPIHDRMPVVLSEPAVWQAWLDPALDGPAASELLVPLTSDELTIRPANPVVNSVENDGPECLSERPPERLSLQASFDL